MKKNDCNIIRDLMPLVIDGVASEESRKLVNEHIVGCETCSQQYSAMRAEMPRESQAEHDEEQKLFTDALISVRIKKLTRRVTAILIIAAICLTAGFGGLYLYDALFRKRTAPIDNAKYTLTLSQLRDGRIVITADYSSINYDTATFSESYLTDGKMIEYCYLAAAPLHPANDGKHADQKHSILLYEPNVTENTSEIRQGTPDNYMTLWKNGDPIPAASEEMEAYFALHDQYHKMINAIPLTEKGIAQIDFEEYRPWQEKLDQARQAVPEWK